jgi:uncharacterized membrane protein YvlD (DUF360 family)
MTGRHDPGPSAPDRGWFAFQRLQARLIWEWRPTRLAILRRTVLSYLGACFAVIVTGALLPELRVDGLAPLMLAGLALLALDTVSALVLHWLLVAWPILVAQVLGLVIQFAVIIGLGRVVPGLRVGGVETAVWGAVLLTLLNSLFAELVAVSDDDSYYGVLVRRLVARNGPPAAKRDPGLLVVQIDGLSLPILRHAMRAGRAPVLGSPERGDQRSRRRAAARARHARLEQSSGDGRANQRPARQHHRVGDNDRHGRGRNRSHRDDARRVAALEPTRPSSWRRSVTGRARDDPVECGSPYGLVILSQDG